MKILFFSSFAHLVLQKNQERTSGGAELQVALLARELARLGHEIVIAGGDVGQADNVILDGVLCRNAGKFHTGYLPEMIAAIPRVVQVLREERPDWVVVMGWTAWLFILWALRPFLGFKLDFTCSLDSEINGEYRREHPVFGSLFEFALRRCNARHSITSDQQKVFRERGMEASFYRYLLIPRRTERTSEKQIDLLWVSRCQQLKRPHLFLDLAEAVPEAQCTMICPAEDKKLWDSVSQRAAKLPNVNFIEKVPYHEIQKYYDLARVFVNTSTYEGFPNSFIQSGMGHAALLSLSINPDGMIHIFESGILADDSMEKMIHGARTMLSNPGLLVSMQGSSARMVGEWLDNPSNVKRFLEGLT